MRFWYVQKSEGLWWIDGSSSKDDGALKGIEGTRCSINSRDGTYMVVELIGKERFDLSDTGHGEGHIPDPRKEEGAR